MCKPKLWFCGDHISCLFVHLFVILILTCSSLFCDVFALFLFLHKSTDIFVFCGEGQSLFEVNRTVAGTQKKMLTEYLLTEMNRVEPGACDFDRIPE